MGQQGLAGGFGIGRTGGAGTNRQAGGGIGMRQDQGPP